MALALKPRLLLLDEPTAGMGDQETYDITRLIRRLHRDQKLTIVLIEHDMRVIFHLADRIMVLAEGACWPRARRTRSRRTKHVQAAYLGKENEARHERAGPRARSTRSAQRGSMSGWAPERESPRSAHARRAGA